MPAVTESAWEESVANLATEGLFALADAAEEPTGSLLGLLLPLIVIGGLFYVMMILPQRRRMKAVGEMRDSVQVGDEVRTVGGIYGVVASMEEDEIALDVGGGTILRILKRAIADRITKDIATDD